MLISVLEAAAEEYELVVATVGNHEHYDSDDNVDSTVDDIVAALAHLPNVKILRPGEFAELDGVRFIGSTGWYDFRY
jgi:hypothetical protein